MKIWEPNSAVYVEERSDVRGDQMKKEWRGHTCKEKQTKYKYNRLHQISFWSPCSHTWIKVPKPSD